MEQPKSNPSAASELPSVPHAGDDELDRWVVAACDGSDEALGKVLQACRGYLLSIANRELDSGVGAKLGASDIVQETLLEACQGIDRFEGTTEGQLLAWLRTILKHNLQDVDRHYAQTEKRRISREEPQAIGSHVAIDPVSPDESPSAMVGSDEEVAQLTAMLDRLPRDYREVIELRNWQLLPFGKIGKKMGRSEEAARKLWGRAIERLQQEMTTTNDDRRPKS